MGVCACMGVGVRTCVIHITNSHLHCLQAEVGREWIRDTVVAREVWPGTSCVFHHECAVVRPPDSTPVQISSLATPPFYDEIDNLADIPLGSRLAQTVYEVVRAPDPALVSPHLAPAESPAVIGGLISARLDKAARVMMVITGVVGQRVEGRRLTVGEGGRLGMHYEKVWLPSSAFAAGGTAHTWKVVVPRLRVMAMFQASATQVGHIQFGMLSRMLPYSLA